MATCEARSAKRTFLIAVVGNPNCGKTTIFNSLTGLRQKVGNYPGVTVEKREGTMFGEASIRLLDLPGTYSLWARSLDEQIARDVLLDRQPDAPRPDAVLVVVDATNLERNLYLASQVIELGLPVVVACNVMDLLENAGHSLDTAKLSEALGVPVVPTVGHRGKGLGALRTELKKACGSGFTPRIRQWSASPDLEREVAAVASALNGEVTAAGADGAALLLLSEGDGGDRLAPAISNAITASLERLGREPLDVAAELTSARYAWLGRVVNGCLKRAESVGPSVTDRLDSVLTHRVWGMLAFALMMALLFTSIFIVASPLTGLIEAGVTGAQSLVTRLLPEGLLADLLRSGVIAGAGNVVAFFPQICILFLFIALLEDSGYMARAAFLMDRVMSRVGLHGKSFIPLLSCHACAIPGIMATRIIENPRDRLTTIMVAPFITCSARLPVYTILIAACLPGGPWLKAGVLLAMYGFGIAAALTMATLFKKTLFRGPAPGFLIELPPYRVPRPAAILRVMWDRSKLFLSRAGTIILAMTIVLWALMSFPRDAQRMQSYEARIQAAAAAGGPDASERIAAVDRERATDILHHSFAGRLGRLIEPVIRPLGYDWRIGMGLISSFAAREVFVGTMAVAYSVEDADDEEGSLRQQLAAATWPDGRALFTPGVALGLMVFYALACQCVSTIAVVRRETNGWRWPLFMFGYMSVLAYLGALLVYQVWSRIVG